MFENTKLSKDTNLIPSYIHHRNEIAQSFGLATDSYITEIGLQSARARENDELSIYSVWRGNEAQFRAAGILRPSQKVPVIQRKAFIRWIDPNGLFAAIPDFSKPVWTLNEITPYELFLKDPVAESIVWEGEIEHAIHPTDCCHTDRHTWYGSREALLDRGLLPRDPSNWKKKLSASDMIIDDGVYTCWNILKQPGDKIIFNTYKYCNDHCIAGHSAVPVSRDVEPKYIESAEEYKGYIESAATVLNVASKFIRGEIEGNHYGNCIENAESYVAQINAICHNITQANVVRTPRLTVIEGGIMAAELQEAAS